MSDCCINLLAHTYKFKMVNLLNLHMTLSSNNSLKMAPSVLAATKALSNMGASWKIVLKLGAQAA